MTPFRLSFISVLAGVVVGASVVRGDDFAVLGGADPKGTIGNATDVKRAASKAAAAKNAKADGISTLAYLTLMVARDPAVHADLRLTRKQLAGVKAAVAQVDGPLWQLRGVPVEKCGDKLQALLAQLQNGLKDSLTSAQLKRLNQIVRQSIGWTSVMTPEVLQQLQLSDDQLDKLKSAVDEIEQKRAQVKRDGMRLTKAEEARMAEDQTSAVYKFLTTKQKLDLSEMIGKPFDIEKLKQIGCAAPELRGIDTWINSEPLTLAKLRGKVVVVHFWAFGCINCIHNLPHYKLWHERFQSSEVTILGMHTPETAAERNADNLRRKVKEYGIEYPVAFDAAGENWKAWANPVWPSVYLIDKQGNVRAWWYGELAWQGAKGEETLRAKIEELLAEK
jgi:thiol-disulfide isomerase/thioredoxin